MATYDLTSSIPATSDLVAGDILNCPYSGNYKTVTLPRGTFKLECWGAQGGSYSTTYYGGKGGYSVGTIELMEDTVFYLYAGGKGTDGTTSGTFAGGWNGGGQAYTGSATYDMSAGGGGSDIRIGSTSLYSRVIVAGGGGGAGSYSSSYRLTGGSGGGTSGVAGSQQSTSYKAGQPGTATAAGISYYGTNADSTSYFTLAAFGTGGAAKSSSYCSGGGGGWYGGGGARRAAGGGGSGYVYTSSTASNYPSGCTLNSAYYLTNASTATGASSFTDYSGSTVTGHSGNGACRITVVDIYIPPVEEPDNNTKNIYIKTGVSGSLPSEYAELDYIESDGSQCINTGFNPNNNTRIKLDFELFNISNTSALFGGRNATQENVFGAWFTTDNTFCPHYGNVAYNTHPISIPDGSRRIYEINKNCATAGNSINKLTTGTFQSSYPLYLLAMNDGGAIDERRAKGRLYSCKIWDNETLIRDYVPALQISSNQIGLYDIINSTFYSDASGGNFIYNKNSYIDSNTIYYIKGNNSTENLGTSGTVTNNSVINTPNDLLYFDGNGYLSLSNNIITGINDWSIDWWEYRLDATDSRAVYHSNYSSRSGYGMLIGYSSSNKIYAYATSANSTWNIFSGLSMGSLKVGEWVHRAMCRKGSNFYTFENGKLISTATSTASIAGNLTPTIGYYDYSTVPKFYGYIKHLRISNIARWTGDFTPPNKDMDYGTQYSKIDKSYINVSNRQIASFSNSYYALEYIESNGTQYINTGFTPNQNSAISIDVQCSGEHSTHAALCSARPTTSTSTNTIMIFLLNGTAWNVDRGTNSNRTAFSTVSLTDRISVDLNKHHMSFNKGEIVHNFSSTDTFTCGGPLALLYDYSHSQYPMKARLFGCKVWDNDTLIRDYVPALRISDGMAGLYDKVNFTFYTDAAGGNFIYNTLDIDDSVVALIRASSTFDKDEIGNDLLASASVEICPSGKVNDTSISFPSNTATLNTVVSNIFTTNDFTIDWWEYYNSHTDHNSTMILGGKQQYSLLLGYHYQNGYYLYASSNGTTWNVAQMKKMGNVLLKQWVHRAVCRKGSNLYCFENGKLINTFTNFSSIYSPTPSLVISGCWDNGFLDGAIDEVRVSSVCRWTFDFEPPIHKYGHPWRLINSSYIKTFPDTSDFTPLKYLESTGTQYTDTGLIPNQSTKTVIDCILPTTSSGSYYICGARESSYVGNYSLQTTSGVYYSKHGTADVSLSIDSVDYRMKMIKDGNVFSVDGNLGYNTPVDYTSPNSMYLFACNSAGTVYGLTPCKIYRVQIYQDGETLSRDMIPALRNSDKKTGFYDLINSTFYPNLDTTAEFNYVIGNKWEKIF